MEAITAEQGMEVETMEEVVSAVEFCCILHCVPSCYSDRICLMFLRICEYLTAVLIRVTDRWDVECMGLKISMLDYCAMSAGRVSLCEMCM